MNPHDNDRSNGDEFATLWRRHSPGKAGSREADPDVEGDERFVQQVVQRWDAGRGVGPQAPPATISEIGPRGKARQFGMRSAVWSGAWAAVAAAVALALWVQVRPEPERLPTERGRIDPLSVLVRDVHTGAAHHCDRLVTAIDQAVRVLDPVRLVQEIRLPGPEVPDPAWFVDPQSNERMKDQATESIQRRGV